MANDNDPSDTTFPHYVQAIEPSSPEEGEFWWDTGDHLLKYFDGTDWTFEGSTPPQGE